MYCYHCFFINLLRLFCFSFFLMALAPYNYTFANKSTLKLETELTMNGESSWCCAVGKAGLARFGPCVCMWVETEWYSRGSISSAETEIHNALDLQASLDKDLKQWHFSKCAAVKCFFFTILWKNFIQGGTNCAPNHLMVSTASLLLFLLVG